jgi:hypothetical protein
MKNPLSLTKCPIAADERHLGLRSAATLLRCGFTLKDTAGHAEVSIPPARSEIEIPKIVPPWKAL